MNYLTLLWVINGTLNISLKEAKDLAFKNSPHYFEAKAKVEKSRINYAEAISYLLPAPTAQVSYTKMVNDQLDTKTYSGSLNISQPIFDPPLFTQVKAANYQYRGDQLNFEQEIQNLSLKVEISYYNLIRARELLGSSELTLKRAKENARFINEKFSLGAASKLDKLQAEVYSLQAENNLSQAQKAFFEAQEGLKTFLAVKDEVVPADSLKPGEEIVLPPLDSLIASIEKVNLGLRTVKQLEDAARLNLISSYFKFLPRLSLFFRYGYANDQFPDNVDDFKQNDSKSYGVNIDLPIFNLKDLFFYNREARANYKYQKYFFLRTSAETRQTLITTYYSLAEIKGRLKLSEKSMELAEEAARIARERYRLGAASIIELLTSEENFYRAKITYIGTVTDYLVEQTKFKYLTGQLEVE